MGKKGSILSDYTIENYLKAIVKDLAVPNKTKITTGELAALLSVTSGTATTMIKKLEKEGYVTYVSHHGCSLTPKGAEYGLRILRRHRLLETFLVKVLNLDWTRAHEEAERLEHSASDWLMDQIALFLEHPAKDPSGNIIPSKEQTSYLLEGTSLLEAPLHEEIVISRVSSDDKMVNFFQQEHLVPGVALTILEKDENTGLVAIKVGQEKKTISLLALKHLFY